MIRSLERTAGLKDLRFEAEPAGGSREMQSVVDAQGRIVGWFSWEAGTLHGRRPAGSFSRCWR